MEEDSKRLTDMNNGMWIYEKIRKIKKMKKHMKDHLELLYLLTLGLMKYKIVKICYIYVFCQYSFATILTIYYLLSTFDTKALLRHGSFCGIQIYVLVNLGTVVFMADDFIGIAKRFRDLILPTKMLDENIYAKVMIYIKLLKVICCINMLLAVMASAGFVLAPEYFNKRTYLVVWIRQTFPEYSEYMLIIVSLTSIPVALMLAGCSITWTYCIFHGVIQAMIINQAIRNICNSSTPKEYRYCSELYQRIVKEKLIICLMMHQLASGFIQMTANLIEVPLAMFSLGGVILGSALMIEVLSSQENDFGDEYFVYVGIVCFALATAISANLYIMPAEWVKEESENSYNILVQLPWYYLNRENKQIFTIFMRRLETPLTVTTSLVQIDLLLLVRIVRALYSMAAMLARFVSSTKPQ